MGGKRGTAAERFWPKVDRRGNDECWLWTASVISSGYGSFMMDGGARRTMPSHRAAWILTNGPVPDGLFICHACDVKLCCNPSHLYAGTVAQNAHDAVMRDRLVHRRKHDPTALWALRQRLIDNPHLIQAEVAREFGISPGYLSQIRRGKPHRTTARRFVGQLIGGCH